MPLLLCSIFTTSAVAEMYKWVDKEGNISYSDQPPFNGAEKLDAPALTTVAAPQLPVKKTTSTEKNTPDNEKSFRYTYLKITNPEHDATIRNNQGNFSISITIQPALNTKLGHYFGILLDGKTVQDKIFTTSASLTNIDRGTHKVSVVVKNKQGQILHQSKGITVHLHRRSALHK